MLTTLILTLAMATPAEPQLQERFPAFRLPTVDGASVHDLRDYRGRKVLLIDFASW